MNDRKKLLVALGIVSILVLTFIVILLTDPPNEVGVDVTHDNTNEYIVDSDAVKNVKNEVDQLLQEIIEKGPLASSNPYDYIKDSEAFARLAALGNPALIYMFENFSEGNENGLKQYIMASACAKIMGINDEEKGIGINNGREWFYKYYSVVMKDAELHIVDADYELFKETQGKPKLILPASTNPKNMEDVIANSILSINRRSYRMGEKAIEAHKIYSTEEKDGIINVYMLVSFRWFGFENNAFTNISGGGGEPARMQLRKTSNGEYEVLEYKQAMDGGMWAESIRDMFPHTLAEIVLNGDELTSQELWEMQMVKGQEYLAEIDREGTPVTPYENKNREDKGARKAINLVTMLRQEFPDWDGTREILVNAGGKPPGMKIRCLLETECLSVGEGEYSITLTKNWDITINGIQPLSYWKYKVTGESVELIEEQDNDDLIRIIK
ncbi:MAG: hypothetical protein CVU87_05035 [Firmicutes bacterium HGW-Firmicutes-12]|nr:MAG: hypothetical protein CVU87_05035 [Firmicutes bacterium HGW-Firmicutes-12]